MPPMRREKERRGENINKTISSHYNAVRLSIFILRLGTRMSL